MTIIRLIYTGVHAFLGYSACIAFIVLKNYPSAILGLFSGITDSILFFLHYLFRKGELRQWYDQANLRIICRYGIVVATVGLLCLGYFTTIQIMHKTPILPIPESNVISIVWSFILMWSGILLMRYCIYYQGKDYHATDPRLLCEPVENSIEQGEEEMCPESHSPTTHDSLERI